jgi:UDP-glucose 4-epimerase
VGGRIAITGISRHLAGRLAGQLEADPEVEAIFGFDLDEPEVDLERTEFVRADIRNPLVLTELEGRGIDTLVHLSIIATPTRVGGRGAMKEINVIGSLQLFAAAQKLTTLRRVVMKSTTAVYGSSAEDPAAFTEDLLPHEIPRHGYAKDAVEVAQAARDFARRRPDVCMTIFRFANFMGSQIETPLTRYLSLPIVPTALGHDPRIQFVHEDDAVEVLRIASRTERPGIFNVAGDGVLYLSQAIRRCGKVPLPIPLFLASGTASLIRRSGLVDFPADQVPLLVHGRVVDTTRLRRDFGFTPAFTTEAALDEFIRGHRSPRPLDPARVERIEGDVRALLGVPPRAPAVAAPSDAEAR